MSNTQEVVKDFSDYYNDSISLSLEKIHQMRYVLGTSPKYIMNINMEIGEIFIRIRAKLNKLNHQKLIDKIDGLTKKLSGLQPMRIVQDYDRLANTTSKRLVKHKDYKEYKEIVGEKEICIWECLELLGMTSKDKDKSKLVG